MKTLLISGSPRKGNTEFILSKIYDSLKGEKDLVLLRNRNIQHCKGCLACDETKKCAINDDMAGILDKMILADTIVIGTPSYYYNVSGLLKDFIDRTTPLYETGKLDNKKVFTVISCGEEEKGNEAVGKTLKDFSDLHNMKYQSSYYFHGIEPNAVQNNPEVIKKIDEIIVEIEK